MDNLQDTNTEAALLGALLLDPESAVPEFVANNRDAHTLFYELKHKNLFKLLVSLVEQGKALDMILIASELRRLGLEESVGGISYVAGLQDLAPSALNAPYYAKQLRKLSARRQCWEIGNRLLSSANDQQKDVKDIIAEAQNATLRLHMDGEDTMARSMSDLVSESLNSFEEALENRGKLRGIPTGLSDLDRLTGGFRSGQMMVFAARPGMGKTSLALTMAEHMAVDNNIPVAIFSLEMSDKELVTRMVHQRSGVSMETISTGPTEQELKKVVTSGGVISKAPLHIIDTGGLTLNRLCAMARTLKATKDIQCIIVDYLQLIRVPKAKGKYEEVTQISQDLKQLAKELRIPLIALAQLNRGVEGENRTPRLSDLRDSGSIEQDADLVGLLHDPAPDAEGSVRQIDLHVAKHRQGRCGSIPLVFFKDFTRFEGRVYETVSQGDLAAFG